MLVPISWLKDYVDIEEKPKDLAEKLLLSGTKVEEIRKKGEEVVFDLEITPNRGDCLGIIGVAREVAVLYNQDLKIPQPFGETSLSSKRKSVKLEIKDKDLCPYYTLGIITNLKVEDSPAWLKKRLELAGIRPINNVVDITNYVMLETAQPMHAFDYDKVKGSMTLRSAKEGERVTTLDGVERKLNKGAIIIEDSEKLIDLAGLMGGQNSEVSENTATIVLHVPIYNSVSIRRASQFTGLRTEASNRFEKMLDSNGHRFAFERALHLLKVEAGGSLASEIKSINYPTRSETFPIAVGDVQEILGIQVSQEEIMEILSGLGFEILPCLSLNERLLEVRPPTWRPDVRITEDVAEEVGRIWGYNRFPRVLPSGNIPTHEDSFFTDWKKPLATILRSLGFTETYSHSMTNLNAINNMGYSPAKVLKVNNRMTVDYEYLRPTLLIGLLESLSLNLKNFEDVSLFEVGRVFSKEINRKSKLPNQPRQIAALSTASDFQSLKGLVEKLLQTLGIKKYEFERSENETTWDAESANLQIGKEKIGVLGKINQNVIDKFAVKKEVFGFELDFDKLVEEANSEIKYEPLPIFPSVQEDLSIAVVESIKIQDILDTVYSLKEPKLKSVTVGEAIAWQGKKSVLLNLEYYDPKKTLNDKEAEKIRRRIIEALKKGLRAEIRSK